MPNSEAKYMVFIDGSNMYHGQKDYKFKIDYEKFRDLLRKDRNIIRFHYYEGYPTPLSSYKEAFYDKLRHLEMTVRVRPLRKRKFKCKNCEYEKEIPYEKGIDASLSTDLLWHGFQKSYDTAIILTGDDDFVPPIEIVKLMGKRVEIWTFKTFVGKEMRNIVDKINYIDDIIEKIKRDF
ncbi:MAG: NYN domain-containing protein [Candidatus Thorarchaeota archaeon]